MLSHDATIRAGERVCRMPRLLVKMVRSSPHDKLMRQYEKEQRKRHKILLKAERKALSKTQGFRYGWKNGVNMIYGTHVQEEHHVEMIGEDVGREFRYCSTSFLQPLKNENFVVNVQNLPSMGLSTPGFGNRLVGNAHTPVFPKHHFDWTPDSSPQTYATPSESSCTPRSILSFTSSQLSSPRGSAANSAYAYLDPKKHFFRSEEILSGLNPDIDPEKKEQYLEDKEFERIFGMTKIDFNRMALWKRQNMKAKIGWAGSNGSASRRASASQTITTARRLSNAEAVLSLDANVNLVVPSPVFGNRK